MGEEFAGPEKLGLAPKVLQNLWGSAEPFFNRLFTMRTFLQNPKGSAEFWGTLGSPGPSFQALQILLPERTTNPFSKHGFGPPPPMIRSPPPFVHALLFSLVRKEKGT